MNNYTHVSNDEKITHLNENSVVPMNFDGLNPLIYYYSLDGRWVQKELPIENNRMQLGKNPYECEVKVNHPEADDVHVVIQRTGLYWLIIESGKAELMYVNGMPRRQAWLENGKQIVIHLGDTILFFSSAPLKPKIDANNSDNDLNPILENEEYSLSYNGITEKFHYKDPCIIGSDNLCHICITNPQFAAMVVNVGRKLYICRLSLDPRSRILADNIELSDPTHLLPGSTIHIDGQEIVFKLSKDLRFTKSQAHEEEDNLHQSLNLVHLDENGHPEASYYLPSSGGSTTLGRSPDHAQIPIYNTRKISRMHCNVITYDKAIMVMDNNSTNGCYVNGKKINRAVAKVGDIVILGDLTFILCFK